MDDYILELPNFVSPELCKKIVNIYKNPTGQKIQPSFPIYRINGEDHETARFSNVVSMQSQTKYKDVLQPTTDLFKDAFVKYTNKLYTDFEDLNKEFTKGLHPYTTELKTKKHVQIWNACTLHEIEKGQFYSWHHDYEWNDAGAFIQIIIYLNTLEEGEGGCTEFLNGRKVRPEIGKVLVFPRSWTYLHKGGEVIGDNAKYICTASIRLKLLE
ncbi:hypothetical protein OMVG_00091 [Ostreococcus lucimarinus virus OlV3]|nr:hypothetical protein OMVG_00091 [Ostreococcus lucimarinus virus OlV3]